MLGEVDEDVIKRIEEEIDALWYDLECVQDSWGCGCPLAVDIGRHMNERISTLERLEVSKNMAKRLKEAGKYDGAMHLLKAEAKRHPENEKLYSGWMSDVMAGKLTARMKKDARPDELRNIRKAWRKYAAKAGMMADPSLEASYQAYRSSYVKKGGGEVSIRRSCGWYM